MLSAFSIPTSCAHDKTYKIPMVKFGNPLSKAMGEIIAEFYSVKSKQVIITRADKDHQSYLRQSGIINEVLYDVKGKILIRIEAFDRLKSDIKRFFNIFVLDSYESFRKILDVMSTDDFDFTGFYTILLTSIEKDNSNIVRNILHDCWEHYIVNVNVLSYDPLNLESALMHTYFPFAPHHCGEVKPVTVGIYEQNSFSRNSSVFPDKVRNFYKCTLTVGTFHFPPNIIIEPLTFGSSYVDGFEGVIMRSLGQRLNFSYNLQIAEGNWGRVAGENSTGASRMLLRGEINFTLGSFASSFSHYGAFSSTIPYHVTSLTLLVPPGRSYTAVERLFLPMKYIIWSCIAACLVLAAIAVTVGKFLSPAKRSFIFGQRNNYPFINTINIFLGGCVPVVPRRNFARFLLMLWIFASLVIRSSYQGALFSFLKDSRNVTVVDTFEEMLNEGFRIYGVEGSRKYFDSLTRYKSMFVTKSSEEIENLRFRMADHDFKGAVVTTALVVAYMNEKYAKDGISFRVAKEQIIQMYICIYVRKYSYLTKAFDGELWKYIESGLINKWSSLYYDMKNLNMESQKSAPQALNIDQLNGIFLAYILFISLSCLVFVLEILSKYSVIAKKLCNFIN
ncbi:glutamate receptor U1-like [Phlebotomus argentipes]|uniref:glutamate receptor U1-like n=1 Tax=Phlebotomus argentipes TaxID=94469 RepID=UPI0028932FF2|nr:glutamate receptor U1-like [Phlebotomus argentipes]